MDLKPQLNHEIYILALRQLTPAQRLKKALEMSKLVKRLFRAGLRKAHPDLSEDEFHTLYLERLALCHNRNW